MFYKFFIKKIATAAIIKQDSKTTNLLILKAGLMSLSKNIMSKFLFILI